MKILFFHLFLFLFLLMTSACHHPDHTGGQMPSYTPGSFGYDLQFLSRHDTPYVLESDGGKARVIVSAKYQGKVFTSTADGDSGRSFGWVNYKAFDAKPDPHMNGYGGENRIWLGPEGGPFSLFFHPGAQMVFANWKTPAAFDTEPWQVTNSSSRNIGLKKEMELTNYAGTALHLSVDRKIAIYNRAELDSSLGLPPGSPVLAVGYHTVNTLTNTGDKAWTAATGMPCIWILDMFRPGDATVIVAPYKDGKSTEKAVTADYFGAIGSDRLRLAPGRLFFRADGKSRGKLGISPRHAGTIMGSYDAATRTLTVIRYDVDSSAKYLGQRWNISDAPFSGDAVNAYNDGPLADGSQMGPFYEMESVSPAAFLAPGASLTHSHAVYHFTGDPGSLDTLARRLLGVPLDDIANAFQSNQ